MSDKLPIFNELWEDLHDFAFANREVTFTPYQLRELFDVIQRDVQIGELRLLEYLAKDINEMKFSRNYPGNAKDESQAAYDMALQDAITYLNTYFTKQEQNP